jgi:hypothetical protein
VVERIIGVEFVFDRCGDHALARAYSVLVPQSRVRTRARRNANDSADPATSSQTQPSELGPSNGAAPADNQQERRGRA